MKKGLFIFLLVSMFFITACGSSKSEEKLLDYYVDAYTNGNLDSLKKVFHSMWLENITQEVVDNGIKDLKEQYGDDYKLTYEIISKKKIDQDEYKDTYELFKKENVEMTDCYSLDVILKYKGSKSSNDEEYNLYYCKFNGEWFLSF